MPEGLSYHGLKQQGVSGLDNSSYQGLKPTSWSLGGELLQLQPGLNQQGVLGEDSSSYHSLNHLGAVGVGVEPKTGYAWQHLKADCLQPKINHIHKAVSPLLEAHRAQLAGGAANMPGPPMGLDPSLEMIHSRLQRDPPREPIWPANGSFEAGERVPGLADRHPVSKRSRHDLNELSDDR